MTPHSRFVKKMNIQSSARARGGGCNRPTMGNAGCFRHRAARHTSRDADEMTEAKGCLAEDQMAKRSASKRELIDTGRNKMFAKRRADGTFKEMDDVSRSLSADRRKSAKKTVKSGHGDQGDRPRTRTGAKKK